MKHSSFPPEQLQAWARLNDVQLNGCVISPNIVAENGSSKGGGLLATEAHNEGDVLLSVNPDLILSKDNVLQNAKVDRHLRELIEALGDFIQTPRKAVMVFLLFHMTVSDPDLAENPVGTQNQFTDYFRALPKHIPLPTFFSGEEREMLKGTSLSYALESKMSSLEKEYVMLRARTEGVDWCQRAWWDESTGRLAFSDWLLVDAMYRSRALELPRGAGDAMVPVLDMANHAADDRYNARFDVGEDGRVLLLVRDGKQILAGDEITITYGCGGASEMIFSYGFLEENVQGAREMFLSLRAPDDDPLRLAKMHLAKEVPGVRVFTNAEGKIEWESAFVWWLCINEEDGLEIKLLQTIEGTHELQALWNGESLAPNDLKQTLTHDRRGEIFALRATVIIQERIEAQGEELTASQATFEESLTAAIPDDNNFALVTVNQLRTLELSLLIASFSELEEQKQRLLSSRTVSEYLAGGTGLLETEGDQEDDFS